MTHYSFLFFVFRIEDLNAEDEGGSADSYAGKFNVLKLMSHASSRLTNESALQDWVMGSHQPEVSHQLPEYRNFKFYRQWQWG